MNIPEQIDMINRDADLFDDNTQEKVYKRNTARYSERKRVIYIYFRLKVLRNMYFGNAEPSDQWADTNSAGVQEHRSLAAQRTQRPHHSVTRRLPIVFA